MNIGGEPGPNDFFGREALQAKLWKILEHSSVRLEDVRRVGKTWLIKRMASTVEDDTVLLYVDIGGITHPAEIQKRIVERALSDHGIPEKWTARVRESLKDVESIDVKYLKLKPKETSWFENLEEAIGHLHSIIGDGKLIIALDELPWALDTITQAHGAETSIDVLGRLRGLDSRFLRLRWIFAGSIGFHHVKDSLVDAGMTADPFGNISAESVGPLTTPEADELCEVICTLEGLEPTQDSRWHLIERTGAFPFYMMLVIRELAENFKIESPNNETIDLAITQVLNSPLDHFRFGPWEDRLTPYYKGQRELCEHILDSIATERGGREIQQIQVGIQLTEQFVEDRNLFNRVVQLMVQDRYVERIEGQLRFSVELFRTAWCIRRNL